MATPEQSFAVRQNTRTTQPLKHTDSDIMPISGTDNSTSIIPSTSTTPRKLLGRVGILTLQRTIGNRAVQQLLAQPTMSLSAPRLQPAFIQRYDAYEHAQAGDSAPGSRKIKVHGIEISSGEINALADLYGSPEKIKQADPNELKNVIELLRKQKADPKAVTEADWDKATNGRYNQLNLKNSRHFAPQNPALISPQVSTPSGADNRTTWKNYHQQALGLAKQAANAPDDAIRKRLSDESTLVNSFGEHFLVDIFSAGHLFNKDDTLAIIQKNLGLLKKEELAGLFYGVAGKVWVKHSKLISRYEVDIPGPWWPNLDSVDMFRKLLEGMYDKAEGKEAFYSAIIKAVHDQLDTQKDSSGNIGVQVENDFEQWYLSGDRTLNTSPITQKWINKALEQSRSNIQDASYPQSIPNDEVLISKVSTYFPHPTAMSTTAIHNLLIRVTDPRSGMIDAISEVLSNEIQSILEVLEQKGYIRKA